ncbi:hypothetical protein IAG41_01000 [Sphingomonas sp. JC676]|uniref:hypothetical protein n=1 Tax=Sphingomonas sp. JC676 TaxID=2768065 RepID=UPI001657D868|nr:hypothetical protein [Sphingomonas sp. JC676]MBC9030960.1 hypothetical protein [Sphingomonas sp. JC676]
MHRSPIEWGVRIVLVAIVAVLGYYCVTFSLAQVLAKANPALAHRLAPYDGRITAAYAATFAGPEASAVDRARADQLARLALRQDPTAVIAVSSLGLNTQVRGNTASARRLFAYAQKLSRRDLRTQLWSVEDSVAQGDIPAALRWYDVTLRTSPEMGELLFPVLASASEDPAIRTELIRTLARKPQWGEHFLNFVPGNAPDPRTTAAFFLSLHRAGVAVPERSRASTVDALVAKGYYDEAWAYYASIRPGTDRQRSRDPRFTASLAVPTLLDWVAMDDGGVTASIQDGMFDFAAPSGVGGTMLRQAQLLAPGTYRLSGHSDGIDQTQAARPYWALTCKDQQPLARFALPNSSEAGGNFSTTFNVPSGCPLQTLTLVAQPSDAVSGLSGRIDRVELVRVR